MICISKCFIIGKIGNNLDLHHTDKGTSHAAFTVITEERATTGQVFKNYLPVEVYGKQAEMITSAGNEGDVVMIDGAVKSRKGTGLYVMASNVTLES